MNSPSIEQDLLIRARRHDLSALEKIYDQYNAQIYAYAMRLLGDDQLAEDCIGETFSRFLTAIRAGKGPNDFLRAYLYRIAHNWITDYYRRRISDPVEIPVDTQADDDGQPEEQTQNRDQQGEIRRALSRLTADQRLVITLRFIEEWDNKEVAAALQKPTGAVKALQHRALENLRKYLMESDTGKTNENE